MKKALQGEAVKFPAISIEHPLERSQSRRFEVRKDFTVLKNLVSFGEMTHQTLIMWEISFVWVSGDVV